MRYFPSSSVSFFFCSSSISRDVLVGDLLHVVEARAARRLRRSCGPSAASSAGRSRRGGPGGRRCVLPRRTCARASTAPCGVPRSAPGSGCGSTLPSLVGFRPRFALRIAFSIAAHQRRIERLRDDQRRLRNRQRRHLVERHLRAVGLDVHGVEDASPRRGPCARRRARGARARCCASIRFLTSANSPFRSLTSIRVLLGRQAVDRRADRLAHDDAPQVARRRAG